MPALLLLLRFLFFSSVGSRTRRHLHRRLAGARHGFVPLPSFFSSSFISRSLSFSVVFVVAVAGVHYPPAVGSCTTTRRSVCIYTARLYNPNTLSRTRRARATVETILFSVFVVVQIVTAPSKRRANCPRRRLSPPRATLSFVVVRVTQQ